MEKNNEKEIPIAEYSRPEEVEAFMDKLGQAAVDSLNDSVGDGDNKNHSD